MAAGERCAGVHLEIHFAYLLLASQMAAVRGLPKLMVRLGVHDAVISTLDYIPAPGLAAEAFTPRDTAKLARVEEILAETSAEARQLGLGFHYDLPRHQRPVPAAGKTSPDPFSCRPTGPSRRASI